MVRGASACLGVREDEGDATAASHATELRCELVACWLHVSPRVSVAGGSVIGLERYQPYRACVQRAWCVREGGVPVVTGGVTE